MLVFNALASSRQARSPQNLFTGLFTGLIGDSRQSVNVLYDGKCPLRSECSLGVNEITLVISPGGDCISSVSNSVVEAAAVCPGFEYAPWDQQWIARVGAKVDDLGISDRAG